MIPKYNLKMGYKYELKERINIRGEMGITNITLPMGMRLNYNGCTGVVWLLSTDEGMCLQLNCKEINLEKHLKLLHPAEISL
jgi:predicted secreted protein